MATQLQQNMKMTLYENFHVDSKLKAAIHKSNISQIFPM